MGNKHRSLIQDRLSETTNKKLSSTSNEVIDWIDSLKLRVHNTFKTQNDELLELKEHADEDELREYYHTKIFDPFEGIAKPTATLPDDELSQDSASAVSNGEESEDDAIEVLSDDVVEVESQDDIDELDEEEEEDVEDEVDDDEDELMETYESAAQNIPKFPGRPKLSERPLYTDSRFLDLVESEDQDQYDEERDEQYDEERHEQYIDEPHSTAQGIGESDISALESELYESLVGDSQLYSIENKDLSEFIDPDMHSQIEEMVEKQLLDQDILDNNGTGDELTDSGFDTALGYESLKEELESPTAPIPQPFDDVSSVGSVELEQESLSGGSIADLDSEPVSVQLPDHIEHKESDKDNNSQEDEESEDNNGFPIFKSITQEEPQETLAKLRETEEKYGVTLTVRRELQKQLGLDPVADILKRWSPLEAPKLDDIASSPEWDADTSAPSPPDYQQNVAEDSGLEWLQHVHNETNDLPLVDIESIDNMSDISEVNPPGASSWGAGLRARDLEEDAPKEETPKEETPKEEEEILIEENAVEEEEGPKEGIFEEEETPKVDTAASMEFPEVDTLNGPVLQSYMDEVTGIPAHSEESDSPNIGSKDDEISVPAGSHALAPRKSVSEVLSLIPRPDLDILNDSQMYETTFDETQIVPESDIFLGETEAAVPQKFDVNDLRDDDGELEEAADVEFDSKQNILQLTDASDDSYLKESKPNSKNFDYDIKRPSLQSVSTSPESDAVDLPSIELVKEEEEALIAEFADGNTIICSDTIKPTDNDEPPSDEEEQEWNPPSDFRVHLPSYTPLEEDIVHPSSITEVVFDEPKFQATETFDDLLEEKMITPDDISFPRETPIQSEGSVLKYDITESVLENGDSLTVYTERETEDQDVNQEPKLEEEDEQVNYYPNTAVVEETDACKLEDLKIEISQEIATETPDVESFEKSFDDKLVEYSLLADQLKEETLEEGNDGEEEQIISVEAVTEDILPTELMNDGGDIQTSRKRTISELDEEQVKPSKVRKLFPFSWISKIFRKNKDLEEPAEESIEEPANEGATKAEDLAQDLAEEIAEEVAEGLAEEAAEEVTDAAEVVAEVLATEAEDLAEEAEDFVEHLAEGVAEELSEEIAEEVAEEAGEVPLELAEVAAEDTPGELVEDPIGKLNTEEVVPLEAKPANHGLFLATEELETVNESLGSYEKADKDLSLTNDHEHEQKQSLIPEGELEKPTNDEQQTKQVPESNTKRRRKFDGLDLDLDVLEEAHSLRDGHRFGDSSSPVEEYTKPQRSSRRKKPTVEEAKPAVNTEALAGSPKKTKKATQLLPLPKAKDRDSTDATSRRNSSLKWQDEPTDTPAHRTRSKSPLKESLRDILTDDVPIKQRLKRKRKAPKQFEQEEETTEDQERGRSRKRTKD